MSWRFSLLPFLTSNRKGDIYEFGVYTGQSIIDIANILRCSPADYGQLWAFDSFEGLPAERVEPDWQECWKEGEFSSKKYFGTESISETRRAVLDKILPACKRANLQPHLIAGYYCDSLTNKLVEDWSMEPALYVDIDCDIYSSTVDCLDWMFRNKLIVPGTLIGYDDFGGSPGWKTYSDGESRAHKEMCEKYKIKTRLLVQIGEHFPHVQAIFEVI